MVWWNEESYVRRVIVREMVREMVSVMIVVRVMEWNRR